MKKILLSLVVVLSMSACTSNPDSPGLEYMDDMYRSPSVEADTQNNYPPENSSAHGEYYSWQKY